MTKTIMRTGTVKSYIPEEGYGFIAGSDGHDYYFASKSVEEGDVGADMIGMSVSFMPKATSKGMRAEGIRVSGVSCMMWADPENFVVTEQDHIKDTEILFVFGQPISCLTKSTDMGRQGVMDAAKSVGATGVVNFRSWPNDNHLNTYTGQAVYVQRAVPAANEQEAQHAQDRVEAALKFIDSSELTFGCSYNYNVFDVFLNLIPGYRKRKNARNEAPA